MGSQAYHAVGERFDIPGWHQQCELLFACPLGHNIDVKGYTGQPRCHPFEEGARASFIKGQKHIDVADLERVLDIAPLTQKGRGDPRLISRRPSPTITNTALGISHYVGYTPGCFVFVVSASCVRLLSYNNAGISKAMEVWR